MDPFASKALTKIEFRCGLILRPARHAARQASAPFTNASGCSSKHASLPATDLSRRQALKQLVLAAAALSLDAAAHISQPQAADAALVQFPAADLRNSYYLIVPALRDLDACPDGGCWIWPSITQRSYQTAEILASLLGTGYSRIVPEYSFLDPRGVGSLEGLSLDSAGQQLQEGDLLSPNWRPHLGTDGTPNESSQDVLIRVRQVMSICETQWTNTNVIIISPDSDNLSVLQAGILGIDLRRHHDFAFAPGEVRPLQMAAEPVATVSRSYTCRNPPKCF